MDLPASLINPIDRAEACRKGTQLTEPQRKHCLVFDKIFKSNAFLQAALDHDANPLLIGKDLLDLYNEERTGETYLALVSLDWNGDSYDVAGGSLRASLHEHDYDTARQEVRIKGSNIVLNIHERQSESDYTEVVDPVKTLFKLLDDDTYRSYVMYCKDVGDSEGRAWGCRPLKLPREADEQHGFGIRCTQYCWDGEAGKNDLVAGHPVTWAFLGPQGDS